MRARSRYQGGAMLGMLQQPLVVPTQNDLSKVLLPIVGTILPLIGTAIIGKIVETVSKKTSGKTKEVIDKATEKLITTEFNRLMKNEKVGESPFNEMLIMPVAKIK